MECDLTLTTQALDRLLARGCTIRLSLVGDGADVDDTGAMIHPGWGPYVQATLRDHEDRVVADVHAATVAGALTTLTAPHTQTAPTPTPPKAEPKDTRRAGGIGRLTDDSGRITELRMPDSEWATPRPGVRQVWGWIVGTAPCPVGRHDRLRLELPDGTILLGPGRVEVMRQDGRRHAKVYIYD
ncbi:hypothetical protein [Streptosporangium sp. NPDC004631]